MAPKMTIPPRGPQETYTREEFREVLEVVFRSSYGDERNITNLKFPVSRRCAVEVIFSTRPTIDEWDALLAHIAFYKTWYSDDETPPPTAKEVAAAVISAFTIDGSTERE